MRCTGLKFTIVHPGHLVDEPGRKRQLLVSVDDKITRDDPNFRNRIPREDVARVCVACLALPQAVDRSFDLTAKAPVDESDVRGTSSQPCGTEDASAVETSRQEVAALLQDMKENCDYSVNSQL